MMAETKRHLKLEDVERIKILETIASHALTDVLYATLADLADEEEGISFRQRTDYYAHKYAVFKLTDDEITQIVEGIRWLESGNVSLEATFSFVTKDEK